MLDHSLKHIEASQPHLAELASLSGQPFVTAPNKFEALATVDARSMPTAR